LLEIFQVGRRLVLPGWHEIAVSAQAIILPGDFDVSVALRAHFLVPDRLLVGFANVFLRRRPRLG
jgi:hypothetical protein